MASLPSPAPAPRQPESTGEAPPWPWWTAPLAIGLAVGFTLVASIAVVGVLAVAGADVNGADKGAVNILLTLLQDVAFVGAALFIAARTGGVRAADFGLRPPPRRLAAVGWAALSALAYSTFFAVWSTSVVGQQRQDDVFRSLGVGRAGLAIALVAVLVCVVAPLAEEFLFRGFCFGALRPRLGVVGAALAVGVVFGIFHVIGTPVVLLVPLAFLGFVLCLLRYRTESLYPCVALHALNNSIAYASLVHWEWQTVPLAAGALAATFAGLRALTARLPFAHDRALA